MSLKQMIKAFDVEVGNPLRKLILIKLADNANDEGICWPSYETIARICEVSRRSAITHINKLEQQGFLKVVKRKQAADKNQSNVYRLTIPDGAGAALPSAGDSLGGAGDAPVGSAGAAPRTSKSLESPNEPEDPNALTSEYIDQAFNFFYQNYPKKVSKPQAILKFNKMAKALKTIDKLEERVNLINKNIKDKIDQGEWFPDDKRKQFICGPEVYIHNEKWNDEIVPRTDDNY